MEEKNNPCIGLIIGSPEWIEAKNRMKRKYISIDIAYGESKSVIVKNNHKSTERPYVIEPEKKK